MAKLYYDLIKANMWTYEKVGSAWKEQTIALFATDVVNGKLKEEKFEQYTGINYAEYTARLIQ